MNRALIWGAAGGIGRALVARLVADGWTVVAVAREARELAELTPHVLEADVTSAYDVQVAVQAAAHMVEAIDLWVYAAGDITSARAAELTPEEWQHILNANLSGAFTTTHYSLPLLAADAHLIYLGAISERLRLPGLSAYAAAKAGLEAFAEALGKEERKRTVTVLRPGAVDTPFWERVPMRLPKGALTPDAVAERIITAHADREGGTVDM